MKNLLKLLLIFSSYYSHAQTWAPIGAKWHVGLIESFFFPSQGYYLIESIGDTVILGKNCSILSQTRYYSNGNVSIMDPLYMYEDSGKVYHYFINDFYTLYDFNAQPGDTWTVVVPFPSPFQGSPNTSDSLVKVVVDSVTTTIINGQLLKILYVHSDSNDWYFLNPIIEKIGSRSGLFPYIYDWMDFDLPFLRCYTDSSITFQQSPSIDCDLLITSINNISDNNSKIKICPVPFTDFLNIENLHSEKIEIKILDPLGKTILSDHVENNSLKRLNLNLNSGIYFIKFIDVKKQFIHTEKLIKISLVD